MIFRRVLTERIWIDGTVAEKPAAIEWMARNGFAHDGKPEDDKFGAFHICAVRFVQDGCAEKWTATAKDLQP